MSNDPSDKSTALTERPTEIAGRFEKFVRRLFERIGGTLDFAMRRPLNSQTRTDLTALIPPIERALDEKLRRKGSRVIAPNLIELRYDFETYGQLSKMRVEYLQRELRATVSEYIHNRRYATLGDVQVKIGFDVFTRGLAIRARFPDEAAEEPAQSATSANADGILPNAVGTSPAPAEAKLPEHRCEITLLAMVSHRFGNPHITLSSNAPPAGIGRSRDNKIVLDDATVSSFHAAMILSASGSVVLSDLGSSNGTFVNSARLASGDRSVIRTGDRLRFGDVELKVEINSDGMTG